jgi:hypothetical protein
MVLNMHALCVTAVHSVQGLRNLHLLKRLQHHRVGVQQHVGCLLAALLSVFESMAYRKYLVDGCVTYDELVSKLCLKLVQRDMRNRLFDSAAASC